MALSSAGYGPTGLQEGPNAMTRGQGPIAPHCLRKMTMSSASTPAPAPRTPALDSITTQQPSRHTDPLARLGVLTDARFDGGGKYESRTDCRLGTTRPVQYASVSRSASTTRDPAALSTDAMAPVHATATAVNSAERPSALPNAGRSP